MLVPAIFGIHNTGLNLAAELVILFLVVIYLALIYWTWADARRRIADPLLVMCAAAASVFPYVGTIVYMIIRPPEFLDDVRERELEMQAAEARLAELGYHLCPHCDYEVEKDFLRCPNCMRKLKDPCPSCGKPLDPVWKVCPFCEAEIGAPAAATRRPRRRRESPAETPVASGAKITAERGPSGSGRGGLDGPAERGIPGPVRGSRDTTAERGAAGSVRSGYDAPAERDPSAT